MITNEKIQELISEKLRDDNCFIVYLDVKPGNNIQLEIDSPSGVSIKDCIDFSREIEHNLDRETEDFELHVSSPGLDKPLRVFQQYQKNIGRDLHVVLFDEKVIEGTLKEVSENEIRLTYTVTEVVEGKKKKIKVEKEEIVSFTNIKEATIIISFK